VRALPTIVAALAALGLTGPILRFLSESGWERPNYRDRPLPFPAGIAAVAAATVALAVVAPLDELAGADALAPELRTVLVYALGVALLGLIDDVFSGAPRGWRGHGGAALRGSFSTGALKAVGSLGLALYAMSGLGLGHGRYLLAVAVLLLATNLLNLLDLRPGRSAKALALLGAGLTLGAWDAHPAAVLGLFAAPLAVLAFYDLRERAMLGDTGSNLAGAIAGLWLVLTLSDTGLAIALGVLAAVTAYGEFRSISALVERVAPLRRLDSLGRPTDA
jgi:UDP-N-acetylmuramyl pentapeptide phosphotransferase/UDP-N-acetylglucosamine-1-phosphate transferase